MWPTTQGTHRRVPEIKAHKHVRNHNRQCRALNARVIKLAEERKRLVQDVKGARSKRAKMAEGEERWSEEEQAKEDDKDDCNLDLPPNTSQAKVAHAFQAITKLRDWTREKLRQEARDRKAADAREARIRAKEVQEIRDRHDELARKFFEPYREIKGSDMQKYAPKSKRDRGTEPAKFCELVKLKSPSIRKKSSRATTKARCWWPSSPTRR